MSKGRLKLWFEAGVTSLSVRSFVIEETVSQPFEVAVMARSHDASIDLEALVGRPAALIIEGGVKFGAYDMRRRFQGVLHTAEQVRVETSMKGESTYTLRIAPVLWLLGQRRNTRIFQHLSIPDIVAQILGEWSVDHVWQVNRGAYPKLEYRAQYGETDLAFVSRLLEEAGIAYTFPDHDGAGSQLTFSDALAAGKAHPASPLVFVDTPSRDDEREYVTRLHLRHVVRPGAFTIRDYDFRHPDFTLQSEAPKAKAPEDRLEQYVFHDGAMLTEGGRGGDTPVADDKGVARHDERAGKDLADRSLSAARHEKRLLTYETNTLSLAPGVVFVADGHPQRELEGRRLLATGFKLSGTASTEWEIEGRAVFCDDGYRPPLATPKPEARGVETAVVVGPPGEEIHTDEFGRVRVQFPWDREGKGDDDSSCWLRVSQGWAGTGFGSIMIPRVGQEVLVGFVGADPDRPLVVGRVFNMKRQVPYKLPDHKSRSTWKSDSYPGGGGFNEIMFEDAKERELVFVQAQKNLC
jgi:type VI secretion system secreted protein VgrG